MLSGAALGLEIAILQLPISRARSGKGSKERLPGWRVIQPCRPPRHISQRGPGDAKRWGRFALGSQRAAMRFALRSSRASISATISSMLHNFVVACGRRGRYLERFMDAAKIVELKHSASAWQ